MKTLLIQTTKELINYRNSLPNDSIVGLVPTMGALHNGHKSLIEHSRKTDSHTIVSVFVNPTQFGQNEDFSKYPRNIDKDFKLCEESGVAVVFAPSANEMYLKNDEITLRAPKNMGYIYEGFIREGHFDGVLSIVLKLLHLSLPHHAYFGQKDAQQLLIVKRLVQDTFLPTKIIPCPTQRDPDGLAMSSRNIYLSDLQRKEALKIPAGLSRIAKAIKEGETKTSILIELAKIELTNLDVQYLDICDYNLNSITHIQKDSSIALIAAKVGQTRLLDNLWI
ncbi:pantoate--beta-alanine ligase [Helicobacter cappadocius]|uniref:Pantothenate synthetase n=1 Tax=Helicobacter cappadocius TaxID=3063998 RepID=A0AA90TEL1_9HELI|nr:MULTISPECIES: pantoate--beta-alanine ligase [unclassified Helicobacter]MDO7253144.1 pantoate--beta-alanine ligase [Helicobacter sp. faydin-H75]MDP2538730.1 pantoate--beta-alanine ligase [Helicobacter sp. faydin-H76]